MVVTCATLHLIIAKTAKEPVIAIQAIEDVVAVITSDLVIAVQAAKRVVAGQADHHVRGIGSFFIINTGSTYNRCHRTLLQQ
nr:hypothetical protein [Geminicoccus flavidas]